MGTAFKFSVDNEGVGTIVFDLKDEKVNKLSLPILQEFDQMLDEAARHEGLRALAIASGKSDIFIAGADLHSFEPVFRDPTQAKKIIETGHHVLNKLQSLPFPTIALINGACLGGGLELALACTYRVVSDNIKTILGLPEVTLGIIPGWGGTQRLPRLVGLEQALPMILSGKPINAVKAWKINLADALVPVDFFAVKASAFIRNILTVEGEKRVAVMRKPRGWRRALVEKNPLGRNLLFNSARKEVLKKTKGHYPAPLVALDLIKQTYELPLDKGLAKEIETFITNVPGAFADAPNLIHLFFVQEALKKDKGVADDVVPAKVASVGVIGAGVMGSAIAWLFSNQEIPVRIKDVDWTAVGKGLAAASAIYGKLTKEKRMKASEASLKFHRLSGTIDYSGFKNADLVIEAAVENLDLKRQVLKELEGIIRPDALIGTNTSSLRIADMGSVLAHPERLVGMHFFNPPNRMPLVEVVAGEKTSSTAIATAVDICRKLGKSPIVVKDCPGFLVNRIFVPGANEIMMMYDEGTEFERLEKIMLGFGMPMSPFVLADEVGNDVSYKVSKVFQQAYGERMIVPKIIEAMNEHQLFGKKNGKGFYLYKGDKRIERNPEADKLRSDLKSDGAKISDQDILDRVMFIMVNEATRCLYERVVEKPGYVDIALVMGIGFPPFRGGILSYADQRGINIVVDQLKRFQERYGERFAPCELLVEMQRLGKTFF